MYAETSRCLYYALRPCPRRRKDDALRRHLCAAHAAGWVAARRSVGRVRWLFDWHGRLPPRGEQSAGGSALPRARCAALRSVGAARCKGHGLQHRPSARVAGGSLLWPSHGRARWELALSLLRDQLLGHARGPMLRRRCERSAPVAATAAAHAAMLAATTSAKPAAEPSDGAAVPRGLFAARGTARMAA